MNYSKINYDQHVELTSIRNYFHVEDYSRYSLARILDETGRHSVAIVWDDDMDIRVYWALAYFYATGIMNRIQMLGERKGQLHIFYDKATTSFPDPEMVLKMRDGDRWGVYPHSSREIFDRSLKMPLSIGGFGWEKKSLPKWNSQFEYIIREIGFSMRPE